jgi:DNA topoisomerase I
LKLIIVESPAKTRTISKFLGPDYMVAASYGHIRDLPSSASEIPAKVKSESWARMGVNVDNGFEPLYVVSRDNKKHVIELKKLLKKADELLLATDEDREGEAISWHIWQELKPDIPVKRITFHEITKTAIQQALENPRDIDEKLVRAQESRRILDRLFGYSLSPVLWKKVRTKLSAGRVQSVALRLIVEQEEARQAFKTAEYWDVEVDMKSAEGPFTARLIEINDQRLATGKDFSADTGLLVNPDSCYHLPGEDAEYCAKAAEASQPWRVLKVERKETKKRPSPPFTTSTLQQAASSSLNMSPRQTMSTAQRLYEGVGLGGGEREGLITYMRTDSLTMSEEALSAVAKQIKNTYGPEYSDGPRRYRTKSRSAQEAHEAIRPTNFSRSPEAMASYLSGDEMALYRLIWNRTMASQMTDAIQDRTVVDLEVRAKDCSLKFRANGMITRFPGHLKAYGSTRKDSLLPEVKQGDTVGRDGTRSDVEILEMHPLEHHTTPPARFTEASLIKRLEEEGIGRPSTYAPTVSTIQNREYAVKKNGALVPSYVGMAVIRLLREHFQHYIELKFTAIMENGLDAIADGKMDWRQYLQNFYHGDGKGEDGLVNRIAKHMDEIEYPAIPVGVDPESGEPVTLRIGRNYIYVHIGTGEDNRRAALPVDLLIDELTLEKAVDIVKLREKANEPLGTDPESGKNIYVLTGPFGPYLQLGEVVEGEAKPKRVGLGRGTDTTTVNLEMALRLLSLPREVGLDPESGKPVRAGLGRFGPYVELSRVFASVENVEILFTVTLEEALERIRNKNKKTVLKELGIHPESGLDLKILKGRYGPYVTDGKVNATLGKTEDPQSVTMELAIELMKEAAAKKKTTKKKTTKKKATKKKATKKKTTKKKTATKKTTTKKAAKKTTKKATKATDAAKD